RRASEPLAVEPASRRRYDAATISTHSFGDAFADHVVEHRLELAFDVAGQRGLAITEAGLLLAESGLLAAELRLLFAEIVLLARQLALTPFEIAAARLNRRIVVIVKAHGQTRFFEAEAGLLAAELSLLPSQLALAAPECALLPSECALFASEVALRTIEIDQRLQCCRVADDIRMSVVTEPEEVAAVRAAHVFHVRVAVAVDDVHVARGEDVLVAVIIALVRPRLRRRGRSDNVHRSPRG